MDVQINFKDVLQDLDKIENKEIPYATSRGINDTAFQSKKALSKTIPKNLDVKSKYISNAGVRIRKSNKNQTEIKSSVYHEKEFMYDLETGVDKNNEMAISTESTGSVKSFRGRSARINKRKQPKELISNYKGPRAAGRLGGKGKRKRGRTEYFRGRKDGFVFIARRKSRIKPKNNRYGLIYAYKFISKTKVGKKLHFVDTVYSVARNNGARNIAKYLRWFLGEKFSVGPSVK